MTRYGAFYRPDHSTQHGFVGWARPTAPANQQPSSKGETILRRVLRSRLVNLAVVTTARLGLLTLGGAAAHAQQAVVPVPAAPTLPNSATQGDADVTPRIIGGRNATQ